MDQGAWLLRGFRHPISGLYAYAESISLTEPTPWLSKNFNYNPVILITSTSLRIVQPYFIQRKQKILRARQIVVIKKKKTFPNFPPLPMPLSLYHTIKSVKLDGFHDLPPH